MAQAPIGDEGGPRDCMGCGGKVCGICATEFRPHEDVMCHICRQNPPDPEATASWVLGTSVGEERETLNASLLALEEETRRMESQALLETLVNDETLREAAPVERTVTGAKRMAPESEDGTATPQVSPSLLARETGSVRSWEEQMENQASLNGGVFHLSARLYQEWGEVGLPTNWEAQLGNLRPRQRSGRLASWMLEWASKVLGPNRELTRRCLMSLLLLAARTAASRAGSCCRPRWPR